MLIYRVNNAEFFSTDLEGVPRIRYKTEIEFDDINNNQLFEYAIDKLTNIKFINVDEYRWKKKFLIFW